MLQRILRHAEDWSEPIAAPRADDWLAGQMEPMQTYDAFEVAFNAHRGQLGPEERRQCVHIVHVGPVRRPDLLAKLRDICAAFFWPLRVAVLKPITDEDLLTSGFANGSLEDVLETDTVLRRLAAGCRSDSACTIAVTDVGLQS